MFSVKIHQIDGKRILVAVCDKELLGKKFTGDGLQLDLSSQFYKGELMDENKLLPILRRAYSFNIVGQKITDIALKEQIISEKNIIKIQGIPHAQGVLVDDSL